MLKRKKQSVQDLISPPSIYIYMSILHTYTDSCILKFSTSIFFGLSQVSVSDPWAHIRVPHVQCVCVCRIHTWTSAYTPAIVKNRDNTDKHLSILLMSKKQFFLYFVGFEDPT